MTTKSVNDKVWDILGEGEDRDVLICGSAAEGIDEAIGITIAVMNGEYEDWAGYCQANGLDPVTGWEPEDAAPQGVTVQAQSVQDFLKEMDL